jgi:hypothetical protein
MISIIFWILAAICNAIMDTCSHHFNESVFFYNSFFDTPNSWRYKYIGGTPENGRRKIKIWKWKFNYPVQLTDSFHLFKSLMIVFICISIAFADGIYSNPKWYSYIVIVVVFGTFWNLTFNLFYNHLLIRKK